MLRIIRFVLIIGCFSALAGCADSVSGERVLFDFESDSELDRFHWKCHTLFSLSDEHITHGARSLRLELYPSPYPGLAPMLEENDWQRYKTLCFDIYNPEKAALRITVRIDDRKDYPDYGNRYNKGFVIQPGLNRIHIPFDSLITSRTGRTLDLKKIYRLLIFMVRPEKKVVLYVDYLRLVT